MFLIMLVEVYNFYVVEENFWKMEKSNFLFMWCLFKDGYVLVFFSLVFVLYFELWFEGGLRVVFIIVVNLRFLNL